MSRFHLIILLALNLFIPTPGWADIGRVELLPAEAFGECHFSIVETERLKLEAGSEGSARYRYCHISLSLPPDVTGEPLDIEIVDRARFESEVAVKGREGTAVTGFVRDVHGKWSFHGDEFLVSPTKILASSHTEENIDGEALLVGHQLLRGYISQGGPLKVPGIRVVRTAPGFAAKVSLNFHSITSPRDSRNRVRTRIENEVVDIVRSIRYEPGKKGPTIRAEENTR